jgi:hypothetical protein
MALPSNIPTSFVPRAPDAPQRFRSDFSGAFTFFAYGVLGLVFFFAIGVFLYGRVLVSEQASKDKQLAAAVASINPATAENFVRLQDRLTLGKSLLDQHIAFSNFFADLDNILPATVSFSTLQLSINPTNGTAVLQGSGVAQSFNSLAVASGAFASDGRIKDAIFSSLAVNKNNSVTFQLTATLDPSLIAFSPATTTSP